MWLSSYEAHILAQRGRLAMAENVLNQGEKRDRDANLGLVIVDYLQLMRGHGADSREQEISSISRSLPRG